MAVSSAEPRLEDFWVRLGGGYSLKVARFLSLDKLPASQQLVAALLRADRQAVTAIAERSGNWSGLATGLAALLARDGLCGLALERITDQGLSTLFADLKMNGGGPLLEAIRRRASAEAAQYARMDAQFLELLDTLRPMAEKLTWLRGVVVSRMLYSKPHYRISSDFDLLVQPAALEELIARLRTIEFEPILDDPGFCLQTGIGPLACAEDLFLAPDEAFMPCAALALNRAGWPVIEIKFDPLERGLKMLEIDRFCASVETITWSDREIRIPELVDHLLVELVHLAKHGFQGWHWLYDVHLFVERLGRTASGWRELVGRCQREGVELTAWAGLTLAHERLASPVPQDVLAELGGRCRRWLQPWCAFTVSQQFLWNSNSLPMLVLNTWFAGDKQRKLSALWRSLVPSADFLARYYRCGRSVTWWAYPLWLMLHWLVLFLPAGLVRRTFGRWVWPAPSL